MFTTDPDTGVVNAGAYRMQVQNDGRAASVNIEAGKHGAAHVRAWFEREGRAPVTASLGHDPLLLVVAGTEVPRGVSELEYAGAVLGRPVRRRRRRGHRPAHPGLQRDRRRGLADSRPAASRKGRSASGPATTAAAANRC